MGMAIQSKQDVLNMLVSAVQILVEKGEPELALTLLIFLQQHTATPEWSKTYGKQLWQNLAAAESDTLIATAKIRANALSLADALKEVESLLAGNLV